MSVQGVAAVRMLPAARRNLWAAAWWRYARNRVRVAAAAVGLLIVAASVAAPLLAPTRYDVAVIAESLQYPSARHWLGTDAIGRDVFSRLLYGGRTSLEVALAVVALAVLVGVPLGVAAG
ncbi:MAG TPA: ABC transporter permease, partial [bacterium]|nr:ABC transporter permease [bacterium]